MVRNIGRNLAAHDNRLQRPRNVPRDFDELRNLLTIDEQSAHGGIGEEIEQLALLVEVRHHDRNRAATDSGKPHRDVIETVGAEQQQPRFRLKPDRGKARAILRDELYQLRIGDRPAIGDDCGL